MKKRDGDWRLAQGGSGGALEFKKKRRLGGKGLSLEAFVGANRIKPVVTASQIRTFTSTPLFLNRIERVVLCLAV